MQNVKMGGLGANIGTDEWELAKRKKDIQQQYANNLKQINAYQLKNSKQPRITIEKEKTAREKALEFAKNNVPKPKQLRRDSEQDEQSNYRNNQAEQQQFYQ